MPINATYPCVTCYMLLTHHTPDVTCDMPLSHTIHAAYPDVAVGLSHTIHAAYPGVAVGLSHTPYTLPTLMLQVSLTHHTHYLP